MTATATVGGGFIFEDPDGYYAAFVWNAAGDSVSVIAPPPGFGAAHGAGISGSQQVGWVWDTNTGAAAPALWTGTTASFVNLMPAGFDFGRANATDGSRQVGQVQSNFSDDVAALWSGTAASFVGLHPGGIWTGSIASAASQGLQAGTVYNNDDEHAVVWQGTAASMIDLHPAAVSGILSSEALGISGTVVCGNARFAVPSGSERHAAVWTGLNAASFVDLHSLLGPAYEDSEANAVWTDGPGLIRIVGSGYNTLSGNDDVLLWTYDSCALPRTIPATNEALAQDSDGDMLRDSCVALTSTNDCNNNAQLDSRETLVFTNETFTGGAGAWSANSAASIATGVATLTPAEFGQIGSIVRPPLTAGITQRLRAIFDFRISTSDLSFPGDGFSFSLMAAASYSTGVVFGEEGVSAPGVITVKFNTYENFPAETSNSVTVRYGGSDVVINAALPFQLADSEWHRAVIDLTPAGQVTVKLGTDPRDMVTILSNVQLPGYTPQRSVIGFGGRTGAAVGRHEVANIRLAVNGPNDLNGNSIPDSCECLADVSSDSLDDARNPNGSVGAEDLDAFIAGFIAENTAIADVASDSLDTTYNPNGSVGSEDLDTFIASFIAGC